MIKGFLLTLDVILMTLFLWITMRAIEAKEKAAATIIESSILIIMLNLIFILNS